MKSTKKILIVVFIFIVLQVMILTFLDRYYLVDSYKVSVSYLDKKDVKTNEQLENSLEIKNDNYSISYNEQLIKIYDKKKNSESYISPEDGNKIESIKSSEDGNELLIVECEINKGSIKNYSYNIESNIKR